jgi:SAM-dependent methyltransferase
MLPPNYFAHESAADRYAQGRPYYHPLVIERLVKFTRIARFAHALDVACGAGQSTRALAAVADRVDAIDVSAPMRPRCPTSLTSKPVLSSCPLPITPSI